MMREIYARVLPPGSALDVWHGMALRLVCRRAVDWLPVYVPRDWMHVSVKKTKVDLADEDLQEMTEDAPVPWQRHNHCIAFYVSARSSFPGTRLMGDAVRFYAARSRHSPIHSPFVGIVLCRDGRSPFLSACRARRS
jgi:hypothetical protein